jgi:hypothetical protein
MSRESEVGRKGRNRDEKTQGKTKKKARYIVESTTLHYLSHGESLTENFCLHNSSNIPTAVAYIYVLLNYR